MSSIFALGIDIGGTFIGMHLKKVAVPVKLTTRKIGEANKIALKGKHWMNKDGISKQFAPEDIEKAILEGWKRGRIMPNNPVLSRWIKG